MNSKRLARRQARPYAEMLGEDGSLRDNLSDDQARMLLQWGSTTLLEKAEQSLALPESEGKKMMEDAATAVRLIMQGVNELVGGVARPLAFDVIDDTMMRLLKNLRWLTGQPLTSRQQTARNIFDQARDEGDAAAAFRALMALLRDEEFSNS